MSEQQHFRNQEYKASVLGNQSENKFLEYQMPGYGNPYHRGYVPPHDPRYPQEMQQGVGIPTHRPVHNQWPQVDFYNPYPTPITPDQPVQGNRPAAIRFSSGVDRQVPYQYQEGPYNNYNRADSQYHGDAMNYMSMTPHDFAVQLSDGYIDNRDFQLRCRQEMRRGPQAVVQLLDAINGSLRQMKSPYHVGYEVIGNPQYGNQKLNVTFYGAMGSTPGFLL